MSQRERDKLTTIYWASKASKILIAMFQQSKRYANVEHIELPGNKVYFNLEGARRDHTIPADVEDWSVSVKFQEFYTRKEWNWSTFLLEAKPVESPAARYVLIQHQTPMHTTPAQKLARELDGEEWRLITRRLEAEDMVGVVVGSADSDPPPAHPRIINLVGKTTFSESLSLLNQANGYWGIASALVVAAAQRFEFNELWVKGPEYWLWANRPIYFAPHHDFHFLHLHLTKPTVRSIDKSMQILMKKTRIVNNHIVMPGSIVDVSKEQAEAFVRNQEAIIYTEDMLLEATAKVEPMKKAAKFTKESN